MAHRSAFVSGSTGFIGLNLVEELVRQGWEVTALHRPRSNLEYLRRFDVRLTEGDIGDPASLLRAVPRDVDAVFHVAGSLNLWSRRNRLQDFINIDGTRHVVAAALERGAKKLVHTSSISVYGLQTGRIDETAQKLGARSWINYQRSKYAAEEEIHRGIERGLEAVIINPASILGHYDTEGWARFIRLVHARKLPGVPPGAVSFCHSREVARAHVAAAERGRSGENYLLGGADASYLELIRVIGEVTERPVPSKATPAWLLRAAARVGHALSYLTGKPPTLTPETVGMVSRQLFCDDSKAQRELGYRPVDLHEMVRDSYDWLVQEDLLDE